MAGLRGVRVLLRLMLRLLLTAPLVALLLAVLVDRGASGEVRLTRFPLALVAVDPLVRTCARNSIVFAVVLSLASLVVGSALGWLLGRRSFWGRPLLRAAVLGLVAASPAIMAFGLVGLLGPARPWPWPLVDRGPPTRGVSLESWSGAGLWLVWLWSSMPAASAVVAVCASSSVARVERSWEDAARLAGASTFRRWRTVVWPVVRPPALRAAALVFTLGIFEPGAPIILGLRRTLAYKIVETASRPAPFPGVAAWCLVGGLIALLASIVLRFLSGALVASAGLSGDIPPPSRSFTPSASISRAAGSIAILTAWCLMAWLPLLGVVRLAWTVGDMPVTSIDGHAGLLRLIANWVDEPLVRRLLIDSALVGVEAGGAIVVAFWVGGWGRRSSGANGYEHSAFSSPILLAPPLLAGVGVLAMPWLAEAAAGLLSAQRAEAGLALGITSLSDLTSISGTFSPILPLSVAWALGPFLIMCWRRAQTNSRPLSSAIDAARLAGASRLRARWLGTPGLVAAWVGRFVMAWALAATNLAPALLAAPGTDGPTVAPGFLLLAEGKSGARSLAAALALTVFAINIAAIAVAWACGALPRLEHCDPP